MLLNSDHSNELPTNGRSKAGTVTCAHPALYLSTSNHVPRKVLERLEKAYTIPYSSLGRAANHLKSLT